MKYKVYYNGRRINGRWGRFVEFVRKVWFWTKVSATAVVFGALFIGIGALGFSSHEVSATNTVIDKMPEKIEALKQDVLSEISGCETPGYKESDAPIVLDTNDKMSIGKFMFQVATVQAYEKKLYGKTLTRQEATLLALDESEARALAHDIVFTDGGIGNWYNCSVKHGLKAKVALIQSLEK